LNIPNEDNPATTVYGDLLWRHHRAARENFDGPERKKLFDLIEAFREEYPAECQVWDDRYSGQPL